MTQEIKQTRPKVLLVDDDVDLLETYRELVAALPSKPEVFTANNGTRALSLLKVEPFRLLVCDLRMPKMDGLQVLSIVRRLFPELRTVVITGVEDEHFRSRAYALGVDMYWLKPRTKQDMEMFMQCMESLLGQGGEGGFRGIQSKGLMDIIQMESSLRTNAFWHGSPALSKPCHRSRGASERSPNLSMRCSWKPRRCSMKLRRLTMRVRPRMPNKPTIAKPSGVWPP